MLSVSLLLVCFGLAPMAQAVGPDTEGTIPGSNNGEGIGVLVNRTTGVWNTGTGFEALNHLTGGNQNTATGLRALTSNTNGGFNTATGVFSLFSNTSGFFNCATGAYSLANNTDGSYNTANGYSALYFNTEGNNNTANGFAALYRNTTGDENTAVGSAALLNNTEGSSNTATGNRALYSNTTGPSNTAMGFGALSSNTTNGGSTATGYQALFNSTGFGNTADGYRALLNNITGNGNTALGAGAGGNVTTATNVICIGANLPGANVDNSCFIGNIVTTTSSGGTPVSIDVNGQLGVGSSSRRFKDEIKPMERASEALFALKPVTFRYKKGIDPQGISQFGLVAEEVEAVNPDLVVRDKEGKVNTVRYEAVNAMLLNEFLKEHRKVEELESTVAQQQTQIETLTSGLQKVSAQLELTKVAPRTVSNK